MNGGMRTTIASLYMSKFSKYERRIKQLEEEVRKLNPLSSTGTLYNKTTRGTSRKSASNQSTTTNDNAPRWA